jgi:hypothetical protein
MAAVMLVFAAFLFLLLAIPFLLVALSPLLVLTGSGALVVRDLRHLRAAEIRIPDVGLLWLGGLERIGALEERLAASIERVLALAPASAKARACACVKRGGSGPVSIVRIWGNGGHWLLRTSGGSLAEAAWQAERHLSTLTTEFPAIPGTARLELSECDPGSCPMRRARQRVVLATFSPA